MPDDGDQTGYSIDPEDLPFFASEKRLHIRAFRYWEGLSRPRPDALPPQSPTDDPAFAPFRDHFCRLERQGSTLTIAETGAKLAAVSGGSYQGWAPAQVPDELLLGRVLRHLPEVTESRGPVGLDAMLELDVDLVLPFRAILLPFADDMARDVGGVIAVVSWKEQVIEASGYSPTGRAGALEADTGPAGSELLQEVEALVGGPIGPDTAGETADRPDDPLHRTAPLTAAEQVPTGSDPYWLLVMRRADDTSGEAVARLDSDAPDLVAEAVRRAAQKQQPS